MTQPMSTHSHEAIEHAMGIWRDGWQQAGNPVMSLDWRTEYCDAVAAVLPALKQYTTMQELVDAYFPPPPAVHTAVERVLRPASGHMLNFSIVEDAAYWRRLQQLQTAMVERGQSDP
jgi:hypothetical protein